MRMDGYLCSAVYTDWEGPKHCDTCGSITDTSMSLGQYLATFPPGLDEESIHESSCW